MQCYITANMIVEPLFGTCLKVLERMLRTPTTWRDQFRKDGNVCIWTPCWQTNLPQYERIYVFLVKRDACFIIFGLCIGMKDCSIRIWWFSRIYTSQTWGGRCYDYSISTPSTMISLCMHTCMQYGKPTIIALVNSSTSKSAL